MRPKGPLNRIHAGKSVVVFGMSVLLTLAGCPAPDEPGDGIDDSSGRSVPLRPGQIDLPSGDAAALPDGTYTTGSISLTLADGAGQSIIADRSELLDWAIETGLVNKNDLPGSGASLFKPLQNELFRTKLSPRAQLLGYVPVQGVQTLTLGESRVIVDVTLAGLDAQLRAALRSLGYDPATRSIRAEVVLDLVPTADDASSGASATVGLHWTGITVENRRLTAASSRMEWVGPDGSTGAHETSYREFAFVDATRYLDAVKGVWIFNTVLSSGDDAVWAHDYTLANYAFEFGDSGLGVAAHTVHSDVDMNEYPPIIEIDPISGYSRMQEQAADAIVTIPVGGTGLTCGDESVCSVDLEDLGITEQAAGLMGEVEAVYTPDFPFFSSSSFGFLGGGDSGDQPTSRRQRTLFRFADGLVRLRSTPIVPDEMLEAAGELFGDLPQMPDALSHELVFSSLDLHSQVRLETGEELDGAGDPGASISLIGPRINDLAVRIEGDTWRRPASVGDLVTLTTTLPDDYDGAAQYFWTGTGWYNSDGEWHEVRLPEGTDRAASSLEFEVPDSWSALSGGEFVIFVFAYDAEQERVGVDGIFLEIE